MAEGNRLPSLENAPHQKTDGEFFVYQHYSVTTILQVVTPISILKNVILGSSLQYRFSKITPSLFVDKASCTRQFENEFSLRSLASLFPIKEGVFRIPTRPSLPLKKESFESLRLPLAKGSSTSNQTFLLRRKDVTALLGARNRYALRLADHQRSSPCFAGWDRLEWHFLAVLYKPKVRL